MELAKLTKEELQNKLDVCNDEIGMGSDDAFYAPRADALERVLASGTMETLRAEPLAIDEMENAIDILTDNLDSMDADERKAALRARRILRKDIG